MMNGSLAKVMHEYLNNEDIIKYTMPSNNCPLLRIDKLKEQRLHPDNHKLCTNFIQGSAHVDSSIVSRLRSILLLRYQNNESLLSRIRYLSMNTEILYSRHDLKPNNRLVMPKEEGGNHAVQGFYL